MTHQTKTRRASGRDDLDATGAPRCRRLLTVEQAANGSEDRLQALLDGIATGKLEVHRLDDGQIRVDEVEFETFLSSRKPDDEPASRSARKRKKPARSAERHPTPRPLELLTVEEAARCAKVSVQTVRRWLKSGKLKFYRAGRQIRIDLNDLVEFLSQ